MPHRRPNLSEKRPNRMIEMAAQAVQMTGNKLAFSLGPESRIRQYKDIELFVSLHHQHHHVKHLTDVLVDVNEHSRRATEPKIGCIDTHPDPSCSAEHAEHVFPGEFGLIRGEGIGVFNVLQRTLIMLSVGEFELLEIGEFLMRTTMGGLNVRHRGPLLDELID